jgi:hypothetical protein
LSARICELRADGHVIETDMSGKIGRYRMRPSLRLSWWRND